MRTRGTVWLVALTALLVAGAAASSTQALGAQSFRVLLNLDGSGRVFMNYGSTPAWSACAPDLTACRPFAVGSFDTAGAAPGTVFSAGAEMTTPLWKGNLAEVSSPSVQGEIRGNSVVAPVAASWAGGWEGDYDSLSLLICTTAAGEHCLAVNEEGRRPFEECGAPGATRIDPLFAGRYLEVVDRRYSRGAVFAGVGHPAYYPVAKVEPGATVATAVVGRIAPASGPPSIACGPPRLWNASIAEDGSAEAECHVVSCQATLIAKRGRRRARLKRTLPGTPLGYVGTLTDGDEATRLRLRPAAIERLKGGPIAVAVEIDGTIAARRTVEVRPLPVVAEYPGSPQAWQRSHQ
jgi:hypothetical protein